MSKIKNFKWKHYEPEIILWDVRWSCRCAISYSNVKKMMEACGLEIFNTKVTPVV